MKVLVRIILIFAALIVLVACWGALGSKTVRGRVIDKDTGAGIQGVTVKAIQRGWGRSGGSTVWDKDYIYTTQTDKDGWFTLSYSRGGTSVHLQFQKDGYHSTKPGYPLQDTYIDYWEKPVITLAKDAEQRKPR